MLRISGWWRATIARGQFGPREPFWPLHDRRDKFLAGGGHARRVRGGVHIEIGLTGEQLAFLPDLKESRRGRISEFSEFAEQHGEKDGRINDVDRANVAGLKKAADAVTAYGVV